MAKKTKAQDQHKASEVHSNTELLENPDVLAQKISTLRGISGKNKNIILGIGIAIVALIGGWVGYRYYAQSQDDKAQAALFPVEYYLGIDSTKKVLNGDKSHKGALKIANEYSITKAANLAHLYAGIALMREEKFKEAIKQLEEFKANDALVQGRVYALLGDAHMELNQLNDAIKYYKKAADYNPNKHVTPYYLMKLGLAYEKNKDYKSAVTAYTEITEKYFDAQEVSVAKKYKAQAEELANSQK